ncbi:MAG: DUF5672 family protein [Prevotella sp.]|nr:DUF5672 family protein [Prevotella sp.]
MKKKQCIIVIPVYNPSPKDSEIASFKQGLKILGTHEISLITHKKCDLTLYDSIIKESGRNVGIQYFDSNYFSSVEGYNNLCMSIEFYDRFSDYEYMLIYQLDAWVFRDELDYWCDKGYDYIGAPLFYSINSMKFTTKFYGVGNGGFCLRRISHCVNILKANQIKPFIKPIPLIQFHWNFLLYCDEYKSLVMRLRILLVLCLKMFGIFNNIHHYRKRQVNEDLIFGSFSTKSWGVDGNIPDYNEAIQFSFELHPALLYEQNNKRLPFGCHAFEKWDYATFWKDYIKF